MPSGTPGGERRTEEGCANNSWRAELYGRSQPAFKKQAPWITIAHSTVFQPVLKEVVGYEIQPFGGHQFHGVDLKAR